MKDRIKELRKFFNLNQTEFGDKIGVKQSTITGYETGIREPLDSVLLSICREFDVSEEWLRTGNGEMFQMKTQEEIFAGTMGRFMKNDDPVKNEILLMLAEILLTMTEEQIAPILTHIKSIATMLDERNQ